MLTLKIPCRITSSELVKGVSKSSGNAYEMVRVQGVLDLGDESQIFRTILPAGHPLPPKGDYVAEFAPRVNNSSMELGGAIVKLETKASPSRV